MIRLILDEGVAALGALVELFASVCLLVVDHVAQLWRLYWALHTLEELIGSACQLVYHIAFFKAHVACITTESVPDPFLDYLIAQE